MEQAQENQQQPEKILDDLLQLRKSELERQVLNLPDADFRRLAEYVVEKLNRNDAVEDSILKALQARIAKDLKDMTKGRLHDDLAMLDAKMRGTGGSDQRAGDVGRSAAGAREQVEANVEARAIAFTARGMLLFDRKNRELLNISDVSSTEEILSSLMQDAIVMDLLIDDLVQAKTSEGAVALAKEHRLGEGKNLLDAIRFLAHTSDDKIEIVMQMLKQKNPELSDEQLRSRVNAMKLRDFLGHTRTITDAFAKFSQSIEKYFEGKDMSNFSVGDLYGEIAKSFDREAGIVEGGLSETYRDVLEKFGLLPGEFQEFAAYYGVLRGGKIPMSRIRAEKPYVNELLAKTDEQKNRQKKFRKIIVEMETFIKDKSIPYILLYTHKGEKPGGRPYADVLKEYLSQGDLRAIDIIDLSALIYQAEDLHKGAELPKDLSKTTTPGALLMQMKIIELMTKLPEEKYKGYGDAFKGFLFREGAFAGGESLNLSPDAREAIAHFAEKGWETAKEFMPMTREYLAKKYHKMMDFASGVTGQSEDTLEWEAGIGLSAVVFANVMYNWLYRSNRIASDAKTQGIRLAKIMNPAFLRAFARKLWGVGKMIDTPFQIHERILRTFIHEIETELKIPKDTLGGGRIDALFNVRSYNTIMGKLRSFMRNVPLVGRGLPAVQKLYQDLITEGFSSDEAKYLLKNKFGKEIASITNEWLAKIPQFVFEANKVCPALGRIVTADDIGRITRAQALLKQLGVVDDLSNEAKVAIIQAHQIKGTASIGKGVNGTIYKATELADKARILKKFFTDAQWRTMLQHGICGDALDLIDRRIASGASKSAGFTDDVLKAAGEAADKVDDAAKVADKAAEVVRSVDSFDDLKRVVLEAKTVNDHKKIAELLKTHKKIIDAAAKAGNAEAKALRSSMSVLGRFGKIGFIGLAIDAAFLGANEYQIEQARKTGNAEIVRTLQSKRNVSLGQTAVGTPLFLLSGPQIAAVLPVYIASSVATQAIYDGVTEWEKTERDWLHEHEDALLAKLRELPYGQADYAHRFGDGLYAAYTPISAERQDKIDQINQNTRQEILRAYFMKTMQLHEVPGETEQETHARVKQNVLRRMAFIKGWTSGTFDVSNVGKRIFDLSAEYAELMELKQILQKQNHELVLRYEWEGEQRVLDLRKLIVLTQSTADPKDRMFALQVLHRYKEEFLPQMRIAQKIYEELAEEAKVDAVLSGRAPGLKIELPKGKNSFMLPGLARVVVEMENGERHVGSGVGNQLREPVRQFLDIIDLNAPANRKKYVNDIKKIARYAIVDGKLVKQAPSDGAAVGMRVHENERLNIRRILCSGGDGIVTVVEFAHDPVRNARGRLQQELSRTPKDDPRHIADNREGQSR